MPKNRNNLNLDSLLDLKRAEKPSAEFWDGFQKEFRQRQLQTLMEKESAWSRLPRLFFARSSVFIPLSGVAVVLFVLVVNFQENSPLHSEYYEAASMVQVAPQPAITEAAVESPQVEVVEEAPVFAPAITSPASFVMDLIPNDEPESLSYTREYPTFTIPAENRAVSALVSYTLVRDTPTFSMAGRPRTIGF
ncbi:MAG: hypothetical protein O7C75_15585 [Verrucomicrobia bacterium]|nr:hypothetical protein [Verrucomicrobiota bacterium]